MEFNEKIKALRLERGLSLEAVGNVVGVGKSTVRKWENGDIKNMRRDKIALLAKALYVDPGYLMGWSEDDSRKSADTPESQDESNIKADIDKAAHMAAEILIKYKISTTPIFPLHILSSIPDILTISFTEFANKTGFDSSHNVNQFGTDSRDVVTILKEERGRRYFFVGYNQRLPMSMLQFAFARELGHIVLNHNDFSQDEAQMTEALVFARHLICPRPLIHLLQEKGVNITVEMLGNLTGCYGRSIAAMRQTPGAKVSSKMNLRIRKMFEGYVDSIIDRLTVFPRDGDSPLADFGTYMDNYRE